MRNRNRPQSDHPTFVAEPLESRRLLSARVVGYFPEYRWTFFNKIDWDAVTHVNYFSIAANTDGSLTTTDINTSHLQTAVAAAHSHGDKISIVVGPQNFSTMAGSATARGAFATNITNFCNTYNLDGVDIDWEPQPTGTSLTRFGSLIDSMYTSMHPQNLLITAAVYPLNPGIPLTAVAKMDWLNIMAYNFSYADHSNLNDSVNSLIAWNNWGVPKAKLVLGTAFYGRQGTSWTNTFTSVYDTIIDNYYNAHSQTYPSPDSDLVDGWYISGVTTTRAKTQYVVNNGYGGMMIWELGQDHLNAAGNLDAMSLLPAIKSAINPDNVPPTVSTANFTFATAPHKLSFQFSENVSTSLQPTDLAVRDVNTQASILVNSVSWDTATNTATFTLNNTVPDGRYRATLSGAGVTDAAGNPLAADYIHDFFFLAGDANHDGTVNLTDFNTLAVNFGQSNRDFTQGDFDYDGTVGLADFNILAARFGTSVGPASFSVTRIGDASRTGRAFDSLRDDALA